MIAPSRNSRSIYISMVLNACLCQTRFDSTYPNQLNGIINRDEFEESMNNINKSVCSILAIIICVIFPFLCLIGGLVLLIVGAVMSKDSEANTSILFLAIGGGIAGFGIISVIIGICIMQALQTGRMRKAIAEESTKYCNRSPIPCNWRLETTRVTVTGYKGKRSSRRIHTLVIDIGSSGVDFENGNFSNQISFQPSSNFTQKTYGLNSSAKFCSQCGMSKQNQMSKFCSQCGQPFN